MLVESNPHLLPRSLYKTPGLGLNTTVMETITGSWASVFWEGCGVQNQRGDKKPCFNQTLGEGEKVRRGRKAGCLRSSGAADPLLPPILLT